jgi:hypothetical protein
MSWVHTWHVCACVSLRVCACASGGRVKECWPWPSGKAGTVQETRTDISVVAMGCVPASSTSNSKSPQVWVQPGAPTTAKTGQGGLALGHSREKAQLLTYGQTSSSDELTASQNRREIWRHTAWQTWGAATAHCWLSVNMSEETGHLLLCGVRPRKIWYPRDGADTRVTHAGVCLTTPPPCCWLGTSWPAKDCTDTAMTWPSAEHRTDKENEGRCPGEGPSFLWGYGGLSSWHYNACGKCDNWRRLTLLEFGTFSMSDLLRIWAPRHGGAYSRPPCREE